MTPTPPPAENAAVQIRSVFPPRTIDLDAAQRIAAFLDPCAPRGCLAAKIAKEPREKNAFCLVAAVDAIAVGLLKLQHGRKETAKSPGSCWIRELSIDPRHRRRGIGSRLVRYAWELLHPHEHLAVEVREDDTASQLFLRAAGLECLSPRNRTRRQIERRLYEFRSVHPSARPWRGTPRFTWPPVAI